MTVSERSASLGRRRLALVGLVALALVVAVTAPAPATTDAAGGFSDAEFGTRYAEERLPPFVSRLILQTVSSLFLCHRALVQ